MVQGTDTPQASTTVIERTSDCEITVTRTFDAPASLVFDTMTNAETVKRWWPPTSQGITMVESQADVRIGGSYRFLLSFPNGGTLPVTGEYLGVVPGARLVFTQAFGGDVHAQAMVTLTLKEDGGKTTVTEHERYPSKAALDDSLATGMEAGIREAWDQLDALVRSLV